MAGETFRGSRNMFELVTYNRAIDNGVCARDD